MGIKYLFLFIPLILPLSFLPANESVRERIVILSFKAINIDQDIADIVTENFITEVVGLKVYNVIERNQLDKVFDELKLTGSDDFNERTAMEIGKLAHSKLVILGSVGYAGNKMVLNARVIDVETGSILNAEKVIVVDDSFLFEDISRLAALICDTEYKGIIGEAAGEDDPETAPEEKFTTDERRKEALYKSKEAKYKKYRRDGFSYLISGSALFASGFIMGTVLLMYVVKTPFSETAWINFHNNILGTTYDEQKIANAQTGFKVAYYTCAVFSATGYILAATGLALALASIPRFVKAFKLKKDLELSFYGGFNTAGFSLAIRF